MTRTPRLLAVALVLLLAGALSACSDSNTSGVAVTVNGTEISQSTIDNEIDDLVGFAEACPDSQFAQSIFGDGGDGRQNVTTAFTAQVLQERIVSVLVNDEFERRGLEITQDDKDAAIQQFASQLGGAGCGGAADATTSTTTDPAAGQAIFDSFSQEFQDFEATLNAQITVLTDALAADAQDAADVTDQDVQDYYDSHQDEFTQNCVSHILVDDEATANDLLDQLNAGADFATLAQANSTDTGSAAQGGDLGCQAPGLYVPEFEAAIADATIGQVSGPVQTQFGYHLILVRSRDVQPFDEVADQIRQQLVQPDQDPLQAFIGDALGSADVVVNPRYGSWDSDQLQVVPPEGPASPTTSAVLPDASTATTAPAGG